MLSPFKSIFRSAGLLSIAAVLAVSSSFAATPDNPPELSEKIVGGVAPLSALFEAQKWDDALKAIDALLAKTEPSSFDRAFLSALKAQLLSSKGNYGAAVEPLETALKLADELHLFRFAHALPISEQDMLINLASLYVADAGSPGKSMETQRADYSKAQIYGRRLIEGKKPTVDAQSMWARILYSQAMVDPAKIDMTLMKQAAVEAEKVLYLVIKPKEDNYTLFLAALQQLGDNSRCADVLELMVKKFPNNKSYWPMLFNTYVTMRESGDKTVDLSAVIALERAQAAGQMVANKDNFMLAGLYFNIEQYAFAADMLEQGLRNGKIDPEQKNWELLAAAYQHMNKEARATEIFLEAIKLFPKSPNLELQVGQIYYNDDKHDAAYKHFQAAVAKGLEHPSQTLVLISYLALEDKRLDDALAAAQKAVAADQKSKEAQNILKVIQETMAERDTFLKNKK
jgi:tetratricopeptide (TPR) repeat protein